MSIEIQPQEGPQEEFMATEADVAFYGGGAGGGKSYAVLMETFRHYDNPGFGGMIFRRTYRQIRDEGGLWDTAGELYPPIGGKSNEKDMKFTFLSGASISFGHMQYDKDRLTYQGSQLAFIGYDELTHFSYKVFFYMLSRNRSTCGVKPYIRATCNPDPDSWVADFISWWIDDEGFAIPERSGIIRYFMRDGDEIRWGDSADELKKEFGLSGKPISFTFIPAKLQDNKILMEKDPAYIAKLEALPYVEKMQLLHGNWKIRPAAGLYFKRGNIEIVDVIPAGAIKVIRYWDRASTEKTQTNNPDWTRGVKMSRHRDGRYYIEALASLRGSPMKVEQLIKNTTSQDGVQVQVGLEQDPGQAGVADVANYIRLLSGYNVRSHKVIKDKLTRALAYSAQWEAGNIVLVRGAWNEEFINEHESFPADDSKIHDDIVDASSGAFNVLTSVNADLNKTGSAGLDKESSWRKV